MDANAPRHLLACFDLLENSPIDRTPRHRLDDMIIASSIFATICGAEGWTAIALPRLPGPRRGEPQPLATDRPGGEPLGWLDPM